MTQLKAVNETIKMWLWLAKHPKLTKTDYLKSIRINTLIRAECFLCHCKKFDCLTTCPLPMCVTGNTPYNKWFDSVYKKTRKRYAMQIVNACKRWKARRKKKKK